MKRWEALGERRESGGGGGELLDPPTAEWDIEGKMCGLNREN